MIGVFLCCNGIYASRPGQPAPSLAPTRQGAKALLRRKIAAGEFRPGSKLPRVTELPRLLRVGQQTAVRVLNELAREGILVQRRGSGTCVAKFERPPLIAGCSLRLGMLWPYSATPCPSLFKVRKHPCRLQVLD